MLKGSEVIKVHLEVTDKCNASCPMCARNINGGKLNPNLRLVEMSLNDAKKIFQPDFLKQIQVIQLCGNFGDPLAAQETLEIMQYFRSVNPEITLGIHTNGSLKSTDWWAEAGQLLSRQEDYCKFGLDGLSDTNAIYRRNTSWKKIMENAKSFIAAGGMAHWEFLVFKHNEHQIETAKYLAKEMGFKVFFPKHTSRFFDYKKGINVPFPILDKNGIQVGELEPPADEHFINPVSLRVSQDKESKSQNASVVCMNQNEKSIYITVRGEVYPCCFLAGQIRYSAPGSDGLMLKQMIQKTRGCESDLSALDTPVQTITDSGWFDAIEQNWDPTVKSSNVLTTCRRMCGQHLKLVSAEY